ncbi:MAG: DNA-directed RNA polymerase subunit beta [Candidatus Aminicenantia bacterium]
MYQIEEKKYIERIDYSRIKKILPIPDLIKVQKDSYRKFLQLDLLPEEREDIGLQAAFKSIFPITDFKETASLEFVSYTLGTWECKCGKLSGLENAKGRCGECGSLTPVYSESEHPICPNCGNSENVTFPVCDLCGDRVQLKLRFSPEECIDKGYTYSIPLKVKLRLIPWNKDVSSPFRTFRDIKEQEVYFGDIPLMTPSGTFIINGTERVIVNQLHRSPGVFFLPGEQKGLFIAKVIPIKGPWIVFEYDNKDVLYFRMDKRKKLLGSIFLRAIGYGTDEAILKAFYKIYRITYKNSHFFWALDESLTGLIVDSNVVNPSTGETIITKGKKLNRANIALLLKAGIKEVPIIEDEFEGAYIASPIEKGGEVNVPLEKEAIQKIKEKNLTFEIFFPQKSEIGNVISETLKRDKKKSKEDALIEIFKKLRPSEPPNAENARILFEETFFNPQRYDISKIGKIKFNIKFSQDTSLEERTLTPSQWVEIVKYLLRAKNGLEPIDDIDHLGNRRIRSVGELAENEFRIGLLRMERMIKERMTVSADLSSMMPADLINPKPVIAALKEFFATGELSQFMDQTNILAELTHKRRLSAMGPQGLSRERAGFEVRDVHPTHYGRICPIETPEGPSIGLISSLSIYARINEHGFIETPYRKVADGKIVDYFKIIHPRESSFKRGEIVDKDTLQNEINELKREKRGIPVFEPYVFYLNAWEEEKYVISQANVEVDSNGKILNDFVIARQGGNFKVVPREKVDFIDLSPKQVVSVAASLIPFLEHDDANRALMGSNMQRQAVPLLKPEAPLVGTGMEYEVAKKSGSVLVCKRSGVVESADSQRILVKVGEEEQSFGMSTDLYVLTKFRRTNQNTLLHHRPLVKKGDRVSAGQILADSSCTEKGELALGRNVLVAFIPWRGYNFEDAVIVSEKLIKEDAYTSIHIIEESIEVRDTKLGPEEVTRDIPHVKETLLRNLDEQGIVRIGAYVKPGDILVGKLAPKGETQLTPEEKLLRAIFGEKALDVKDVSLYCKPGVEGTVIDVKVFTRKGADKDGRTVQIEEEEIEKIKRNFNDEKNILQMEKTTRIKKLLRGQKLLKDVQIEKKVFKKDTVLTDELLDSIPSQYYKKLKIENREIEGAITVIENRIERQIEALKTFMKEKVDSIKRGDELPAGVIKVIKVYIATKRRLMEGDKMAGRHGNKGVIAKIVPEEDMPFLPDGTPIEIVLNPLGVPSRMNVGQILETHLGWAAKALGLKFASPVFEGVKEEEIKEYLKQAGLPMNGKIKLRDGLTGDYFDQEVTVGYLYIMKLHHLVEDKIHARATGPYSLITQQPVGGKAQFGGQRFGEMEVWALEAYGAAYTLQEMLTVKSDDITGRWNIYDSIVKGSHSFKATLPESVNVLVKELQSLGINMEFISTKKKEFPWGFVINK